ncbi:MAG: glutamate synthase subunit beta [Kiritimatiellia bacterium]
MGKPGGFLDFSRKEAAYRPVSERLRDFKRVEVPLLGAEVRAQAARCMDCGTPFCHGCGCPLSACIPEINDLVYRGRWREAAELLFAANPFPEFTARLCPALCESACVLGINDEPVSIRCIEHAVVEQAFARGYLPPSPPAAGPERRVAVVGSGPAGLAVAHILNRTGCRVTVYEKDSRAGGILRYGIPDFKLEKTVLDRRLNLMKRQGVEFETGVEAGKDVSGRYLTDRFDAICLAGGARLPRDLKIEGRDLKGIYFAMDFLRAQNRKLAGEIPEAEPSARDKTVVIIGAGDTGSDCLGTALRQGAADVVQIDILSRPPDRRPPDTPWPMWPRVYRESSSDKEGGTRRWNTMAEKCTGANGVLTGVECVEVEWRRGKNGSRSPQGKPGSGFVLDADLALLAMGFTGAAPGRLARELGVQCDSKGNIGTDEHGMTNVPGVFAAGDMARGQSLVVRAINDGILAASDIASWLKGKG